MASILGGLSPAKFLKEHWQKRPLLIRQALPGFAGILNRDTLLSLATREDATSRLILEHPSASPRKRWERHDGPFGGLDVSMLPASHWTVLVHGIESLVRGGWELLRNFSFIPSARIDDLMVSYAAPGGSVGAHDDLYDVFLLQGPGRRRWQISTAGGHAYDEQATIKVIKNFRAEDEWLLEPGDMLYLPPGVAHLGVAEGPCFTYSIGFLAPSHVDIVQNFVGYLGLVYGEKLDRNALFTDPNLRLQKEPLDVSNAMLSQVSDILRGVCWDASLVEDFVGRFLTGPKTHVTFDAPKRPLARDAFAKRLRKRGRLMLALPSRGLTRPGRIFFNGEGHVATRKAQELFTQLIHERALVLPVTFDERMLLLLHDWYVAGYCRVES